MTGSNPPNFYEWFQAVVLRPYPRPENMEELVSLPVMKGYGSACLDGLILEGFPHFWAVRRSGAIHERCCLKLADRSLTQEQCHAILAAAPRYKVPEYRFVSQGGYGINSYSVYWTSVTHREGIRCEIQLRVAYGGVWSTTDADRKNVIRHIVFAERLRAAALVPGRLKRSLLLWINMTRAELWRGLRDDEDPYFESVECKSKRGKPIPMMRALIKQLGG